MSIGALLWALLKAAFSFTFQRGRHVGKEEVITELNEKAAENDRNIDTVINAGTDVDTAISELESGRF